MNSTRQFFRPNAAGTVRSGWFTALLVGCVLAHAQAARAWPVSVAAGYDYYTDYEHESTHSILATGAVGLAGFDLSATGMHYDNDDIGGGNGLSLGIGMPIGPMTRLRLSGTRFVGDESYRAWRIKAGPFFSLPTGQSLGLFYTHDEDNVGPHTNGILAEAGVPLVGGLGARATAGYAVTSEGDQSARGSIGAAWSVFHFVEIAGDVGLAQNVDVGSGSPLPLSREGVRRLTILGGGSNDPEEKPSSAVTSQLGIRFKFP